MNTELTITEMTKFDELEAVIERGIKTFKQVGASLLAIRDAKLYRTEYGTFEDYCRDRWGMTKSRANQLVGSAKVIDNLATMVAKPLSERQARPLSRLPPEQQADAWQAATARAESEKRKVTAKDVEMEVETIIKPKKQEEVQTDPLSGRVDVIDIDPEEEKNAEPPNLAGLKRYWNYANKKERKAFIKWIQEEGNK